MNAKAVPSPISPQTWTDTAGSGLHEYECQYPSSAYSPRVVLKLKSLHRAAQRLRIAGRMGPEGPTARASARRTARNSRCCAHLSPLQRCFARMERCSSRPTAKWSQASGCDGTSADCQQELRYFIGWSNNHFNNLHSKMSLETNT